MARPERVCGILGGMGPEATVHLLNKIIQSTRAGEDSEHVRCLVDQNPQVPSRILAIMRGDADPGAVLEEMAAGLEAQGADFLCMPCNTAHYWLPRITARVGIPFLDMPALACVDAAKSARGGKCGILGTTATRDKAIYEPYCQSAGMQAIYPDDGQQAEVLKIINEVKAGDYSGGQRFAQIATDLARAGADALILACTELSVLGLPASVPCAVVDALDSLAREIVTQAGATLKTA